MSILKMRTLIDENKKLSQENSILRNTLETVKHLTENLPADCTPGTWCRACEFVKAYRVPVYYSYLEGYQEIYICGKRRGLYKFLSERL